MGIPDWSGFDKVQFGGGREEWVRPLVNNGSFYDFGEWVELDLPEGYTANEDFAQPAVRKDSNGTVFLRGVIEPDFATMVSNGNVVATLPEGYRPARYREMLVSAASIRDAADEQNQGSGAIATILIVNTVGSVQFQPPNFIGGQSAPSYFQSMTDPVARIGLYGSFPTKSREDLTGVIPNR